MAEHPMMGQQVEYRDETGAFTARVVGVKSGPMLAADLDAPNLSLRSTIKLRLQPADGRCAFWTAPMEYPAP